MHRAQVRGSARRGQGQGKRVATAARAPPRPTQGSALEPKKAVCPSTQRLWVVPPPAMMGVRHSPQTRGLAGGSGPAHHKARPGPPRRPCRKGGASPRRARGSDDGGSQRCRPQRLPRGLRPGSLGMLTNASSTLGTLPAQPQPRPSVSKLNKTERRLPAATRQHLPAAPSPLQAPRPPSQASRWTAHGRALARCPHGAGWRTDLPTGRPQP